VKELLGHRHVTNTQIHDKRRRQANEGASMPSPSPERSGVFFAGFRT